MVWVFNGHFAISSPKQRPRCWFSSNPSVQHRPDIIIRCRRRRRNLDSRQKPPCELAVASAAQRLRPNPTTLKMPVPRFAAYSRTHINLPHHHLRPLNSSREARNRQNAAIMWPVFLPHFQPLALGRARCRFSHRDWLFELKWDGFRSIVRVQYGSLQAHLPQRKRVQIFFPR